MTEHQLLMKIANDVGEIRAGIDALANRVNRHDEELFGCDEAPGMRTRMDRLEQSEKKRGNAEAAESNAIKTLVGGIAAAIVSAVMAAISTFSGGGAKH